MLFFAEIFSQHHSNTESSTNKRKSFKIKNKVNNKRTKEKLANMKLELSDVPEISDINMARCSKKRDEKLTGVSLFFLPFLF